MMHPNAQRYADMMKAGPPDPSLASDWLAEDVQWYEAGNPTPFRGRDAVLARVQEVGVGAEPDGMDIDTVLADDDHLVVVGRARFSRGDTRLDYRFAEYYLLADGKVVERRSFMDALPPDVERFFAR